MGPPEHSDQFRLNISTFAKPDIVLPVTARTVGGHRHGEHVDTAE
jgi:hypothetical protein